MTALMDGDFSSERYTVSAENLSYRKVFEMIAGVLDKRPPGIHATPFLISLAWRMNWLTSKLNGKTRRITRETVRSSRRKALFSNEKIRKAIVLDFIPIEQSIQDTAKHFLKQEKAGRI